MKNLIKKLFSGLFKSKTAVTSVFTFLVAATGVISQATHGIFGMIMPTEWILILSGVGVFLAEITNRFFPSGELIGTGKNWTVPKYIIGFATAAIGLLESQELIGVLPPDLALKVTAVVIPLLQLVVRVFGGATPTQVEKAHSGD